MSTVLWLPAISFVAKVTKVHIVNVVTRLAKVTSILMVTMVTTTKDVNVPMVTTARENKRAKAPEVLRSVDISSLVKATDRTIATFLQICDSSTPHSTIKGKRQLTYNMHSPGPVQGTGRQRNWPSALKRRQITSSR
jgi:hypothetical protein